MSAYGWCTCVVLLYPCIRPSFYTSPETIKPTCPVGLDPVAALTVSVGVGVPFAAIRKPVHLLWSHLVTTPQAASASCRSQGWASSSKTRPPSRLPQWETQKLPHSSLTSWAHRISGFPEGWITQSKVPLLWVLNKKSFFVGSPVNEESSTSILLILESGHQNRESLMTFLELIILPWVNWKNIKANLFISFYLDFFTPMSLSICFLPKFICREMYNG